MKRQLIQTNRK